MSAMISVKGCPNSICIRNRQHHLFQNGEMFCNQCGAELVTVCARCYKPIRENPGISLLCPECLCEVKEKRDDAVNRAKQAGDSLQKGLKNLSSYISDYRARKKRTSYAGQTYNKRSQTPNEAVIPDLNIPARYQNFIPKLSDGEKIPKDTRYFYYNNPCTKGVMTVAYSKEPSEIPYDRVQDVIAHTRKNMGKQAGIVEICNGTTRQGNPYVYKLLKYPVDSPNGIKGNKEYLLSLNMKCRDGGTFHVDASFQEAGMYGVRDSEIYESYCRNHNLKYGDFTGWESDPYDPDIREGFLMNLSEHKVWDNKYPNHPLTQARQLVAFLVNNN